MRLGTAIELLIDNYRYASDKEWIQDKVAWALYHTWKEADRKTEPTGYNLTPVDKDINVRSKDEPQWTKENCKGCKYNEYPYDSGTCFVRVCINGNKYEPKDEPKTDCAWR